MFAVTKEDHFSLPDRHGRDKKKTLHDLELVFNAHFTKLGIEVISTMIQALVDASDVIYDVLNLLNCFQVLNNDMHVPRLANL